jgi:general secretion pathway protein E
MSQVSFDSGSRAPRGLVEVIPPRKVVRGASWADDGSDPVEDDPLVGYLLRRGLITRSAAHSTSLEARVTGKKVGDILVRQGFLRSDALTRAIIEYQPDDLATQRVPGSLVPVEVLRDLRLMVAAIEADTIYVSSLSPEDVVTEAVREHYPNHEVEFVAFVPDAFEDFLREAERLSRAGAGGSLAMDSAGPDPMMKILTRAIYESASDVHIEPKGGSYSVLFRKLGVRHHVYEGTLEQYNTVLTRIKDRAHMDIAQRDVSQDGSFSIEHAGRTVDVRVTTTIGQDNEKIVARILDASRNMPELESLGITRLDQWRRAVSSSDGMCVVCGVTGSGKTTTLHSTLAEEDRFTNAIYTVEAPVEQRTSWVTQVGVNDGAGRTMVKVLENFLRADPDTIVVGEIRNEETANVAMSAVETGHLVMGTLHCSNARGVVSRMEGLGIPFHQLRDGLRGILVQRLVRTICLTCKGMGRVEGHTCKNPICAGSGYGGRTIISECVSFDSPERVDELKSHGRMAWPTVLEDGVDKLVAGVTTSEELQHHFGAEFEDEMRKRGLRPNDYLLPMNRLGAVA